MTVKEIDDIFKKATKEELIEEFKKAFKILKEPYMKPTLEVLQVKRVQRLHRVYLEKQTDDRYKNYKKAHNELVIRDVIGSIT